MLINNNPFTQHALFYKNLQPSYDLNDHDRFLIGKVLKFLRRLFASLK